MLEDLNDFIFSSELPFEEKAIKTFQFQYQYNQVYKRFVDGINCDPLQVTALDQIPFLPISFFKNQKVITTDFLPELIFESSGTTTSSNSKHFVKERVIYEASFQKAFTKSYGNIEKYCILGLLPSYLEREGSSLVYMVKEMMRISGHPLNGFHLYDHASLADKLLQLERQGQKTLLIGVTYALLDFSSNFPTPMSHTIIMETGGMKGKQTEMVRPEVHRLLKEAFRVDQIHSEYGMTELLSQAYALKNGIFKTPAWMRVLVREEDDPLRTIIPQTKTKVGAINIIDLANIYSCSFIATDDLGKLYPDGSFEILGRMDNSDIRGCSLMVL